MNFTWDQKDYCLEVEFSFLNFKFQLQKDKKKYVQELFRPPFRLCFPNKQNVLKRQKKS